MRGYLFILLLIGGLLASWYGGYYVGMQHYKANQQYNRLECYTPDIMVEHGTIVKVAQLDSEYKYTVEVAFTPLEYTSLKLAYPIVYMNRTYISTEKFEVGDKVYVAVNRSTGIVAISKSFDTLLNELMGMTNNES